ncbi:hypothetical protein [Gelidibacter salicanalis]|uniref:Uncharacterized protein n=1 Tax=Gelidibacter salicanalis TaxID=291193 RepID=A0A934NKK1_9FLAO|nr:hypothetical protein [Gelidibacter salicanalis]MBJ7881012.1 hypothetical protein [Gelidibacter salicanalis]
MDYEEKVFYDSLITVKEQSGFEFPDGENLELAKDIKAIVDDKTSKPN